MSPFSLGSGIIESGGLIPGIFSSEPIGVRVLAKDIPDVYSVLPVVANGDRYVPKRWRSGKGKGRGKSQGQE
jgi:hypothetical protein